MKIFKNILTNYLFKFLFEKSNPFKNGDLLECQGDLFIYDDSNGNPNNLKYYFKQNGFWNYIRAKEGSIYNVDKKRFISESETNSQGYIGLEYYKNSIGMASEYENEIYKKSIGLK